MRNVAVLSCDDLKELTEAWALKMRAGTDSPLEQFEPEDVVSLCLANIAGEYGIWRANETIDDLGLEELGFNKRPVK